MAFEVTNHLYSVKIMMYSCSCSTVYNCIYTKCVSNKGCIQKL